MNAQKWDRVGSTARVARQKKPTRPLPPGAWDSHAHVFGPFDRFPILQQRVYNPPLAPAEDYLTMLDDCGFARGVMVHASVNEFDNGGTREACEMSRGRVIGVGVVPPDISDAELRTMHDQGFRALRITDIGQITPGKLYLKDMAALAPRLRDMGWHFQCWTKCELAVAAARELAAYRIPIVFDHMGYPDVPKGANDPTFQAFIAMLRTEDFSVKLCPVRLSQTFPTYDEARPFHDALVNGAPDRVIFGTDWPFLSLEQRMPSVGLLVDLFDDWVRDDTLRRKAFVDNPLAFFEG